MRRRRYTDAEIANVLRDVSEGATTISAAVRRLGVPRRTLYRWRSRFGDGPEGTLLKLKAAARQVATERRRAARLERENRMLKELLGKPWRRPRPGAPPSTGQ